MISTATLVLLHIIPATTEVIIISWQHLLYLCWYCPSPVRFAIVSQLFPPRDLFYLWELSVLAAVRTTCLSVWVVALHFWPFRAQHFERMYSSETLGTKRPMSQRPTRKKRCFVFKSVGAEGLFQGWKQTIIFGKDLQSCKSQFTALFF
jgi:hypothetical protein